MRTSDNTTTFLLLFIYLLSYAPLTQQQPTQPQQPNWIIGVFNFCENHNNTDTINNNTTNTNTNNNVCSRFQKFVEGYLNNNNSGLNLTGVKIVVETLQLNRTDAKVNKTTTQLTTHTHKTRGYGIVVPCLVVCGAREK